MKKTMLNVITLALVLINLVLTVLLTFSLVSTNNKTNSLITKVAQIIDLDVGDKSVTSSSSANIADISYIDVKNNDSNDITISYTEGGKTHYAVLNVTIGINTKSADYETKSNNINNNMKIIVSQINTEALKYSYNEITANKTTIENNLKKYLQDLFQTDMITTVVLTKITVS